MKYVITQLNNYIITYLYAFVSQLVEPVLVLFDIRHDNGCRQRPQRNVTARIDTDKLQFLLDFLWQPDGDALLVDARVLDEVLLESLLAATSGLARFLRCFRGSFAFSTPASVSFPEAVIPRTMSSSPILASGLSIVGLLFFAIVPIC